MPLRNAFNFNKEKEMKRKITLSLALLLSVVLVSLMSSDRTAQAQNQIKIVADTGVITLGQNQTLRVAIHSPRDSASGLPTGFRRIEYTQGACGDGICKHEISSQTASPPVLLNPNEALTVDLDWSANVSGTRIIVLSSSQDVQVNVLIIDNATGEILSIDKSTPLILKG